jgi:lipopolysaccharide export system permease protein
MRIRVLDRLICQRFLRLFLLFIIGAPLLFILGDATENLDRYLDRGIAFNDVVISYAYQFPQFVFWSFPIAALLATVFTIHPMTTHREVMAAKAGGISFHRLILPLILMGVLLTGVGFILADWAPRANQTAAELRGDRARLQGWRSNFVYITDDGAALNARRLTVEDGRMYEPVYQWLPRDDGDPSRHVLAEEGRWTEERGWVFWNGYAREIHPDGKEVTFRFDRMAVPSFQERPEQLLQVLRDEDEMTYEELGQFADRLLRGGGGVGRTLTKREQRLAIPVAALVIILFGAPLATSSKRGGTAFGIGLSLGTTILYLMLFRLFGAMGYAGTLEPWVAAWLPNGIFLVAGLFLLSRVRT